MKINVGGKNLECVIGGDCNVILEGGINIFPVDSIIMDKCYKSPRQTEMTTPSDIAGKIAKKYLSSLPQNQIDRLSGVIVSKIRRVEISSPYQENREWVNTRVQYQAVVQGFGPNP